MIKISNKYEEYGVDVSKSTPEQLETMLKPQEIALSFIQSGVTQKFPKGLPNDKLRMYNNIEEKIRAAAKADTDEVDINEYELLFIKDSYRDAVFPPANSKAAVAVFDMIFNK